MSPLVYQSLCFKCTLLRRKDSGIFILPLDDNLSPAYIVQRRNSDEWHPGIRYVLLQQKPGLPGESGPEKYRQ